jgi:hypothetical protein
MHRELVNLYRTYENKPVATETVLEIAADFTLDLINVFGEALGEENPLKDGWRSFAPFEFILALNNVLAKFKQSGFDGLEDTERPLLTDHGVLLGSLIRAALQTHPDSFPGEEHFQIPDKVAHDLLILSERL